MPLHIPKFFYNFLNSSIIAILLSIFSNSCLNETGETHEITSWAYQLQNADPNEVATSGFDLAVIDYSRDGTEEGEYSHDEIATIVRGNVTPVAYISIGEAENYRFYWNSSWDSLPPPWLGPENPNWQGNFAVRYWYQDWHEIIFSYLNRILSQGFKGVYLDKVDEFEFWSEFDTTMSEQAAADSMINFILEIARYCKSRAGEDFLIIPQNGETLLRFDDSGELLREISGWAVEDLFYDGLLPNPPEVIYERLRYFNIVLNSGRFVLSVDYVDDGTGYHGENKNRIDDYRARAISSNLIPYAARSDRELDELNIIPGVQP